MTIIYPLVLTGGPEFELTDAQFTELEQVGEIVLSAELRQQLADLAHVWVLNLRARRSPRPKQYRNRLKLTREALDRAREALDLNCEGASIWDYHLFNWARNSGVEGADSFFEDTDKLLIRIRRMSELYARLEEALPPDRGSSRPFDDERLLIGLADIFERAGGATVIYWTQYQSGGMTNPSGGMADTPFHKFVHSFYKMLPAPTKRKPTGLDKAVQKAMRSRRPGGR